jgi:hypothetical protein
MIEDPFYLIGNGWYIDNPDYIRHHEKIKFVPISIHLTPSKSFETLKKLQYYLDKEIVVYTRDSFSESEFVKFGYKAKFLGCLTCILNPNALNLKLCPKELRKGIAYVDVAKPSTFSDDDG